MEPIKAQVRRGYSRSWVVQKYSVVGLWPSEDILCRAYWQPGMRILDLGCGAGRTTIPLVRCGYRAIGVDLSLPMAHQAHRLASQQGVEGGWGVGDATALPFADSSFDGLLFSYNGIELVPGISGKKRVLEEAWRVLRPGGHLIFCAHALEALNRYLFLRLRKLLKYGWGRLWLRPGLEMEIGESVYDPNRNLEVYYLQILSPRTYRRLLFQVGFKLVYYNSRQRIEAGKTPCGFADFDPDFKFYVAQKPS